MVNREGDGDEYGISEEELAAMSSPVFEARETSGRPRIPLSGPPFYAFSEGVNKKIRDLLWRKVKVEPKPRKDERDSG